MLLAAGVVVGCAVLFLLGIVGKGDRKYRILVGDQKLKDDGIRAFNKYVYLPDHNNLTCLKHARRA